MPTEVWIVLVWLCCSPIAGLIYRNKNHNIGLGCLAGFIFGPFGIIWALLQEKKG